jgi:hypothetical protein
LPEPRLEYHSHLISSVARAFQPLPDLKLPLRNPGDRSNAIEWTLAHC